MVKDSYVHVNCASGSTYSIPSILFTANSMYQMRDDLYWTTADVSIAKVKFKFSERPIPVFVGDLKKALKKAKDCIFVGAGRDNENQMGTLRAATAVLHRNEKNEIMVNDEVLTLRHPYLTGGDSGGGLICTIDGKNGSSPPHKQILNLEGFHCSDLNPVR